MARALAPADTDVELRSVRCACSSRGVENGISFQYLWPFLNT